jgi:antibiotic biosynthesis monooxygenase (ABM) superfamily enzyme
MRDIPGFRGADVLRRVEDDEVAFVTLTRFDSLDAIRGFAGEDYERPVLEPQALALLSRYDAQALHFDTAIFTT